MKEDFAVYSAQYGWVRSGYNPIKRSILRYWARDKSVTIIKE